MARPTILARVHGALITGVVAVHAGETIGTLAQVRVDEVHTSGTVGAGAGGAVVDLLLTVEPCVPGGALAEVSSVWVVGTASTVGARPVCTRHGTQLAVVAIKSVRASAGVRVFQILSERNKTNVKICLQLLSTRWMEEKGQLPGCTL